jgi:DNA-binding NarL/FixJ family response regulator
VSWAAQASSELRAAGERSKNNPSAGPNGLTAQERTIAQLASLGLSNRQIGQRVLLSHRTVASHLHHIFPKLGVTSRRQLGGVLRGAVVVDD